MIRSPARRGLSRPSAPRQFALAGGSLAVFLPLFSLCSVPGLAPGSGSPAGPPGAARCTRLLAGPIGEGVAWEIGSDWHRAPLPTSRPEHGLEALVRSDFQAGEGQVNGELDGWLVHESFGPLLRPEADRAAPPQPREGTLELQGGASVAARIAAVPPLTPLVLTLRVRQPAAAEADVRIALVDLKEDLSKLDDPVAIAERIQTGSIVATQRLIGRSFVRNPANSLLVAPPPEIGAKDLDGFETWRVPFTTDWSARALLVLAFGSDAAPLAIDDVTLFQLPVRTLLGLPEGAPENFDLPRPWENLDRELRATKVRCDWENRRALLLPRGGTARCRFQRPKEGGTLELGFAIVREERLTMAGPHREQVTVTVDGAAREVDLELHFDRPSGWADLALPIATQQQGVGDTVELEIRVEGTDSATGALVAASGPLLLEAGERPAAPNVVVISLDTMRADRLGRRVRGRSLTPQLDRLAARSIVFTNALANASYTLPSHISMLVSQRPGEHGVLTVTDRFSQERSANFARIAALHGFATAAFTSGGMLNAAFCGIDRGFDRFGEIDAMLTPDDRLRRIAPLRDREGYNRALAAMRTLDRSVLPWLRAHRDVPFVLFLHTYLVHNYQPEPALRTEFTEGLKSDGLQLAGPVPYRHVMTEEHRRNTGRDDGRFEFTGPPPHEFVPERDLPRIEALYDATVAQADRDVGRILAELEGLELSQRTIVVVTSDHGEEFLEHGDLSHARTLFDEILRVPLVIHVPGLAPRTVADPVELIDLPPTLLARMGIPADPRMRGADLLASDWTPRDVTIHEGIEAGVAQAGADGPRTLRAARSRGAKLILFDRVGTAAPASLGGDVLEQLRALGYVGGADASGGFFDLRSDPLEQTDLADAETLEPQQRAQMSELYEALRRAPSGGGVR